MKDIIKVENLTFSYGKRAVLKELSFDVKQSCFISIAGPNGAGKTTLLNLLSGLLKADAGSVEIDSKTVQKYSARKLARKIAFVRQEFIPVFDYTVAEIVSMARMPYSNALGFEKEADKKLITEALTITDTIQFANRPLESLSGGERQRVFIARAFAQDTAILLLDEPTSFLDYKHQVGIYDLLKKAQNERGKTILTVTHDINLAAQYADVALLIASDNSYVYGPTMEVFSQKQIEKFFDTKIFTADIGQGKFFLPLGKYAKDAGVIKADNKRQK
jgi:iron complex transport system ATP-binding protein